MNEEQNETPGGIPGMLETPSMYTTPVLEALIGPETDARLRPRLLQLARSKELMDRLVMVGMLSRLGGPALGASIGIAAAVKERCRVWAIDIDAKDRRVTGELLEAALAFLLIRIQDFDGQTAAMDPKQLVPVARTILEQRDACESLRAVLAFGFDEHHPYDTEDPYTAHDARFKEIDAAAKERLPFFPPAVAFEQDTWLALVTWHELDSWWGGFGLTLA